jgi:hypothetical protein
MFPLLLSYELPTFNILTKITINLRAMFEFYFTESMAHPIMFKFLIYFLQKSPFSLTFDKFNHVFYIPSLPLLSFLLLYFLQLRQGNKFQILNEEVVLNLFSTFALKFLGISKGSLWKHIIQILQHMKLYCPWIFRPVINRSFS